MADGVGFDIRRGLAFMRAHGDLLGLQVANWLSGQLLFMALSVWAPRGTLAQAAFLEIASAFFGTTLAGIAFRTGVSVAASRRLAAVRFAVFFVMCGAASAGWMRWTWVIGIAPSLLTPAHFPIVFGARPVAAALLVGFRMIACGALAWLALSPMQAFVVYFAPGIAYALALHAIHFDDWAREQPGGARAAYVPGRAQAAGRPSLDAFVLLPWASAGFFLLQASIVSAIAAASPALAVIERLLRSGHSMAYPYLMRASRLDAFLRRFTGAFGVIAPVAAAASIVTQPALWIWVPTLSDFVVTNLFRLSRVRLLTIAIGVTFCALCLARSRALI
ncbi:hypothetical protein AWB79_06886 [Caballeronia hypogeia]|uniref:Uncharacterized protein n=1 Tax=Caballeronia hypogeia TaxID=1777140 RepID=A0A158DEE3_9BURK|nr:hypothetical protein [Caballeronia hypogeia]SAK92959.1 hypothetical protein AWB79_06886 [Caballeronia hypogeia]